jgi:hypothetical protein
MRYSYTVQVARDLSPDRSVFCACTGVPTFERVYTHPSVLQVVARQTAARKVIRFSRFYLNIQNKFNREYSDMNKKLFPYEESAEKRILQLTRRAKDTTPAHVTTATALNNNWLKFIFSDVNLN